MVPSGPENTVEVLGAMVQLLCFPQKFKIPFGTCEFTMVLRVVQSLRTRHPASLTQHNFLRYVHVVGCVTSLFLYFIAQY